MSGLALLLILLYSGVSVSDRNEAFKYDEVFLQQGFARSCGHTSFSPCAERPGGEQAARPKLVNVFWSRRLDDATGGHVTDHQHIKRLIRHCTPSRIGVAVASVGSEPHHLKGCAASSSDLNGEVAHVIPPIS
jgi:hypothetical protein